MEGSEHSCDRLADLRVGEVKYACCRDVSSGKRNIVNLEGSARIDEGFHQPVAVEHGHGAFHADGKRAAAECGYGACPGDLLRHALYAAQIAVLHDPASWLVSIGLAQLDKAEAAEAGLHLPGR